MSFQQDVQRTAGLEQAYQTGLGALRAQDRARVEARNPRALSGSVDVDKALQPLQPNANRWDYVVAGKIANSVTERLYWIEVHPASSSHNVREIQNKLDWLLGWLQGQLLDRYKREFLWLASGKSVFHQNSPQVKILAGKGIQFKGRHFTIPG
jgi:hypothetical protein